MDARNSKVIVAIVGEAGVGKDTVARMLRDMYGFNLICSYTTRPKREGEMDGVEHYFVDRCDIPKEQCLAYTKYGGYEYWTTEEQLKEGHNIYVIDEKGLIALREHFPNIRIEALVVYAPVKARRSRGVTEGRMRRDKKRQQLPLDFYRFRIMNYGTLENLEANVRHIGKRLKETLWA